MYLIYVHRVDAFSPTMYSDAYLVDRSDFVGHWTLSSGPQPSLNRTVLHSGEELITKENTCAIEGIAVSCN